MSSSPSSSALWLSRGRPGLWLAAGAAAVGLAVWRLHKLSQEKHTDCPDAQRLPAGVAAAATADPDPTLFPQLFPSASVPGLMLHRRQWLVSNPRAIVFVLHGYAEHSGRYEAVAAHLNAAGFSVYSFDHQGHGRSGGDRAHVQSFDHYVIDALHYIRRVQSDFDEPLPCFLLGHSMGGLVATQVMHASYVEPKGAAASAAASSSADSTAAAASEPTPLQREWRGRLWPWSGCILSAPALAPNPKDAKPALVAISRWLSDTFPKMQVSAARRSATLAQPSAVASGHAAAEESSFPFACLIAPSFFVLFLFVSFFSVRPRRPSDWTRTASLATRPSLRTTRRIR